MTVKTDPGVAIILVLLVTSFLSAVGLGLALVVFMDQLASGNHRGSVAMLYAADAGIELAARDLALAADWNGVLAGTDRGSFTDGAPTGVRAIPGGGAVNLTAETNLLNCGKRTACTSAQMDANSRERPWAANNPRWRLYAYGPFQDLVEAWCARSRATSRCGWPTTAGKKTTTRGPTPRPANRAAVLCASVQKCSDHWAGGARLRLSWPASAGGTTGRKTACPAFVCSRGRNCAS